MGLGLGSNLTKGGLTTPGIVTDNLVLKHNYSSNGNVPVSDGAAYFDNTDDYITIPEITFSWHDTPYTISFWAYRNQIDDWDIVLGNDSVSNYNFIIFDNTNGDRIIVEGSDADNSNITVSHSVNEWHHYAIVSVGDGNTIAYQNGVQCTVSDTCDSDIVIHRIGRGSGNPFGGYICNVGMWGRALTQEEVKSIMWKNYALLTDTEKTSMLRWYNLDVAYDIDDTTHTDHTTQYVFDNHHGGGDALGDDVMVGGDMSSDAGWFFESSSGWSISDGKLIHDGTDAYKYARQTTSGLTAGSLYKITVDISITNGHPLVIYLGEGHGTGTANAAGETKSSGTQTFYFVAGSTNDNIYFYAGSDGTRFQGTIDNVIIQKVNGSYGVLS